MYPDMSCDGQDHSSDGIRALYVDVHLSQLTYTASGSSRLTTTVVLTTTTMRLQHDPPPKRRIVRIWGETHRIAPGFLDEKMRCQSADNAVRPLAFRRRATAPTYSMPRNHHRHSCGSGTAAIDNVVKHGASRADSGRSRSCLHT